MELVVDDMRFVLRKYDLDSRRYVADVHAQKIINVESSTKARLQYLTTYFQPITFASNTLIEIAWSSFPSSKEAVQMLRKFASKYQHYLKLPKSISEFREERDKTQAIDDRMNMLFLCLCDMLQAPTENIVQDVEFLIRRTECPMQGDQGDLLALAIDQSPFSGQLTVVQMLISAGATPDIANKRFDNLLGRPIMTEKERLYRKMLRRRPEMLKLAAAKGLLCEALAVRRPHAFLFGKTR